ncbi:DNA primase [Pseudorhodobacter antarcticus]|uniref:DNA primase n=1 Tax=Pseudorhodobacter antarcticus TaxID=1077947 RepID=A0A1H8CRF9_9RHOB|nr:DNA primase [Pseudorhodobacter antarcticus]SEM96888.1 DNA primase [Pseudorhodobacter antarcticus]
MSLPPGFIDELRTRVSLSQVVGRKVTWDMRKSNQGKGDMWAPCPFHQEKSASFHVDDRKGFYYCFGCQAKGDALGFIMESENLGFMEAVELLAREAGMPMPARDPQAAQKADRRSQLAEVMEEAIKFCRLQLKTTAGQVARDYLDRRGLNAEAQERWGIGWSPEGKQAVFGAMQAKGFAPDLILASGVCAVSDHNETPYDRFRARITFPIRDGRGRAISLGGRSLDPAARAKYLNGPETELFDKGRNLYNLAPAREAAGKGAPLVVAEGYMDVIALCEAGFRATVAPLGTAVTEEQLRLMWRVSPEPIIALDGDAAGLRAALRVIDLALPLLEAGQGLRFAVLPKGLDPDDLIKAQGAGAMQAVLDNAQPMVNLLWQRETEGRSFDSPERKAALDKTLRTALMRIKDASIRGHYGEEIKRLRWDLFGQGRGGQFGSGPRVVGPRKPWVPGAKSAWQPELPPVATTKSSALVVGAGDERVLEQLILAVFITHPSLVLRFEAVLERLEFTDPFEDGVRLALLQGEAGEKLRAGHRAVVESVLNQNHVMTAPPILKVDDPEFAEICAGDMLRKLRSARGGRREVREAEEDLAGLVDEGLTWRLAQANEARFLAAKGPEAVKGEGFVAENGVEMDKDELSVARSLWDRIDFGRGGRSKP